MLGEWRGCGVRLIIYNIYNNLFVVLEVFVVTPNFTNNNNKKINSTL